MFAQQNTVHIFTIQTEVSREQMRKIARNHIWIYIRSKREVYYPENVFFFEFAARIKSDMKTT